MSVLAPAIACEVQVTTPPGLVEFSLLLERYTAPVPAVVVPTTNTCNGPAAQTLVGWNVAGSTPPPVPVAIA